MAIRIMTKIHNYNNESHSVCLHLLVLDKLWAIVKLKHWWQLTLTCVSSPNKPWWIKPSNQSPVPYYFQPHIMFPFRNASNCVSYAHCTYHLSPAHGETTHIWAEQEKLQWSIKTVRYWSGSWPQCYPTNPSMARTWLQTRRYTHTHTRYPQHINANLCYLSILPWVFI